MRRCMTSFAILLALIAFSPTSIMAKGPGGGGGGGGGGGEGGGHANGVRAGGGEQGGEHHGNAAIDVGVRSKADDAGVQGMKPHQVYDARNRPEFSAAKGEGRDSWRYCWDNGRWWFWGPDNRWMWYGDDGQWLNYGNAYVVQRPIAEGFSGGPIKIVNPAENKVTLNYTLGGQAFSLPPGYSQELREDRDVGDPVQPRHELGSDAIWAAIGPVHLCPYRRRLGIVS